MSTSLRDTREHLFREFPGLHSVERIRCSRAAYNFSFSDKRGFARGIRLWNTNLVISYVDGPTTLNTGGYHTISTMKYINYDWQLRDLYVFSERGEWKVYLGSWVVDRMILPLEDGMVV